MFGERIKIARNLRKITQSELGKYMGVSQRTVAAWESEQREPSINALTKSASFFEVSVSWLVGSDDSKTVQNENSKVYSIVNNEGTYSIKSEEIGDSSGVISVDVTEVPKTKEELALFVRGLLYRDLFCKEP